MLGERWALLIVRDLLLGPKRFTDIQTGLTGAGPNVLTTRLNALLAAGVVRKRTLPPPAGSRVYELTEWGEELEPVIVSLGRWGARSSSKPGDAALGMDSLVLSLRTMFDPRAAEGLRAAYEFRFGEDRFRAVVDGGRFEISRGTAVDPDAVVEADSGTLAEIVYAGRPLAEALEAGDLKVEGDRIAFERFLGLFPLPEPAPSAGA